MIKDIVKLKKFLIYCTALLIVFVGINGQTALYWNKKPKDSYFNHIEKCEKNDITIQENDCYITGNDPYIVLNGVRGYISNVNLLLDSDTDVIKNAKLVFYYDVGKGFNEKDKKVVNLEKNGEYSINIQKNVYALRLDIEGKISHIKIENLSVIYNGKDDIRQVFVNFCLFYIIVDLILLIANWFRVIQMNNILNKVNNKYLFLIYVFEKYLFSMAYVSMASVKLKIIVLLFNVLIISTLIAVLNNDRKKSIVLFLASVFCFYFIWMLVIPFNKAPDEEMRYLIPKYMYKYGRIPRGEDSHIRNSTWGISYGFTPILSYIISAIFMRIMGLFNSTESYLLLAARLPSVFLSTGTVAFSILISDRLFSKKNLFLMPTIIAFLPQFAFISSYVNCDALALFSVAWIVYALLRGKDHTWDLKSCIILGSGLGICLMSYYNAYGIILIAIGYCITDVIKNDNIKKKPIFVAIRVLWVIVPVVAIAGGWFIRNYILYRDILGLTVSRKYAELYAVDEFKPSNRLTPYNQGIKLSYMLFKMGWIKESILSFIGKFGYMDVSLRNIQYIFIGGILLLGLLMSVFCKDRDNRLYKSFEIQMWIMCFVTIAISIYYSFYNDYQPQGRYCLPMLISVAFLVSNGYNKLIVNKAVQIIKVLLILYIYIGIDVLFDVIFNAYI